MRTLTAMGLVLLLLGLLITLHVGVFHGDISDWVKPERSMTMIGVLAGFVILVWQLDRQHANGLKAEALKARNALWLQIYSELADASDVASQGLRARLAPGAVAAVSFGFATSLTFQEMHVGHFDTSRKVIALIGKMEKWEIALGEHFQEFKSAFSQALATWGECAGKLALALAPHIPQQQGAPSPPAAVINELRRLDDELTTKTLDLEAIIWDLRIASQNRLLGGLFRYRVPIRKPSDQSVKVVTIPEEHEP